MTNKKKYLKQFGSHVRSLREKNGFTQKELSARMDKDFQSLQRVERGDVNPSLYYLHELADALGIELNELMDYK